MDFRKFDKKWQARWKRAKLFESNPSRKKKFFTSLVIPYVNGNAHIGHSYTYTRTDAFARFKRMQGYNVLLALGFHATGEPIVGAIERLKNNDKEQVDTFKLYGAKDKDLRDFGKKGPKYVASFWAKKIEESFRSIGFSVDFRRTFTLSVDPGFSRFVEWQYKTLKNRGYVIQGTHPVVWCPKDMSPTGDHDRLRGEGESPAEYTVIKFAYLGYVLPAATLRPETVYGATNVWISPDAEYVEASVDGERWIVSKSSAPKLKDQLKKVEVIGDFDISEILGKRCIEPINGREIPILPSKFVDPDSATGVVMSVPAHAPYDWIALKEMSEEELASYNVKKEDVRPISVIEAEGLGENPAVEIADSMNITSTGQKNDLDRATSVVYKKEFHTGKLKNCNGYSGMKVSESKDRITKDFIDKNIATTMWEVDDVACRCTTKCHVKVLENQWFLKFSDEKWKEKVKFLLGNMKIYPDEARNNFENTLDWMKDKACARKSGLGTPLPWDREWMVETLSDSTIYMAFYTIAHIANKMEEKLSDEVFDYVFLGEGDAKNVAKKSRIKISDLKKMKNEFEYFYPLDWRNSGKDLIQNHLTYFLYHHTAVFPESKWPRGISVNGFVNVEGEKMSKSKGNIIPLTDSIEKYGADMVRINIAGSSQGIDDADWREEPIKSYRTRYESVFDVINGMKKEKSSATRSIDNYLQSRMQRHIDTCTKSMETLSFRDAVQTALFDTTNDMKWYVRRGGSNKKIVKEYLENIVKMLAPFTPHACEEAWKLLGKKGFVSAADWPKAKETKMDIESEVGEDLIRRTLGDIEGLKRMIKIQPKRIKLFVAENWKFRIYQTIIKRKDAGINEITKEIMESGAHDKATVSFIQFLYKRLNELRPVIPRSRQFALLKESKEFLEKELGCAVDVEDAEKTENPKARSASPNKFGIFIE